MIKLVVAASLSNFHYLLLPLDLRCSASSKLITLRKDKYKNYQQKSGKSIIVKKRCLCYTQVGFTMLLKVIYLFNPIFFRKI